MYNETFYINRQYPFKRELKSLNIFWFGFIVYSLAFTLSYTPSATNLFHAIQLVAITFCILGAILLFKLQFESKYLAFLYVCFFTWSIIVICRGFKLDSTFIKDEIYDARYGVFPYFVPLILLMPIDQFFWKKLLDSVIILGIFYLIFDVLYL